MKKKQERRDASHEKPTGNSKPKSKVPGKPYKPRLKKAPVDDGTIRLNKYIANSGMCSRREADELIKTGLAQVNGKTITEMGYKVQPGDIVKFDGRTITAEKNVYILLNKPKGFITTTRDEKDRKTVMDLIANATTARVFPVGRLDRATTGLLLFTNDGYLAKKLTHPSHSVKKIYHVKLNKKATHADLDTILKGVRLIPEGIAVVDSISFIEGKPHDEVGIEVHIGWNRVVRRIFEKMGFEVEALDRVSMGGLTKKNLKRGDWRKLTEKEVGFLKML
ncbi:MAG: pseudouridine synthase [Weeksellaceae bacterium]